MVELPKKLEYKLEKRRSDNALRTLSDAVDLIDFSSNDYLGLATNEHLFHEASRILSEREMMWNGATGSRLLTGNNGLYTEVEQKLRKYHRVEAALVFTSGYIANIGFFASVPQRNDVVFYDEFIHASIRDGIKLGNANSHKFRHNDLADLEKKVSLLQRRDSGREGREIYVVTESVFSMDGDSPDLKELIALCELNNVRLIVDEAHAVGIFGSCGCGLVQELGLQKRVFAIIVTFGKAMGCHGAAILGSGGLKAYLVNFARGFMYTTGLPAHSLATILRAYDFISGPKGTGARQSLHGNIAFFKLELKKLDLEQNFVKSNSAIHSCILPGNILVKRIASQLQKEGLDIRPILSPTVPKGWERLRICLHAYNTKNQISTALKLLKRHIMKTQSAPVG